MIESHDPSWVQLLCAKFKLCRTFIHTPEFLKPLNFLCIPQSTYPRLSLIYPYIGPYLIFTFLLPKLLSLLTNFIEKFSKHSHKTADPHPTKMIFRPRSSDTNFGVRILASPKSIKNHSYRYLALVTKFSPICSLTNDK